VGERRRVKKGVPIKEKEVTGEKRLGLGRIVRGGKKKRKRNWGAALPLNDLALCAL